MPEPFESCIVRIFPTEGTAPAGLGFLARPGVVVTCAHVVNAALGLHRDVAVEPGSIVRLDFPLVAPGRETQGALEVHIPRDDDAGTGDVALLRLDGSLAGQDDPIDLWQLDELPGLPMEASAPTAGTRAPTTGTPSITWRTTCIRPGAMTS